MWPNPKLRTNQSQTRICDVQIKWRSTSYQPRVPNMASTSLDSLCFLEPTVGVGVSEVAPRPGAGSRHTDTAHGAHLAEQHTDILTMASEQ